jgi:hypothetical protein
VSEREPFVDAACVARHLGVERDFVYEHAAQLGAHRLGAGPKARLRFRLSEVDNALLRLLPEPEPRDVAPPRRRRRQTSGASVALLPIRGTSPPDGGDAMAAATRRGRSTP